MFEITYLSYTVEICEISHASEQTEPHWITIASH